jgi:type VI secretion system protein ImpH
MAATRRFSHPSLIARLRAEPRGFRFFQAVRVLERQRAQDTKTASSNGAFSVAEEIEPRQRTVRFRAAMRLSFPASEIEGLSDDAATPQVMTVTFLGLSGPATVLPLHYAVAVWREFRNRNTALRDFFDLFNDRLIAFFYRAWAKYRVPISVERSIVKGDDGISEALRGVIGFGTDHLSGRVVVGEHTLLHYSGFLSHFPRSAASLEDMLCDYFRLPIRVKPFDGRWLSLPKEQRTQISASDRVPGTFAALSSDAVIGESYWDVESSFTVEIGPIDYAAFLSFMPNSDNLRRLAQLVKLYINPELGFRVELCLLRDEVPLLQFVAGGPARPQLGWNTWLRHDRMAHDTCDAAFRL